MTRVGAIFLSIVMIIVIPTSDKWSFKVMHDRSDKHQVITERGE